ncbi:unnamed protein product [Effrenium voratum]|nr:unnamed protein product [Effrenium voratum]
MVRILKLGLAGVCIRLAASNACPSTQQVLANFTADGAALERPYLSDNLSVDVYVQHYVAAIVAVDQKNQQLQIEGYFRASWTDPRFARSGPCAEPITLMLPTTWPIWQPDLYYDNSLEEWYGAGSLTIHTDGAMYRSRRYNHALSCPMQFAKLPLDTQRCFLKMGSYSWDLDNVHTKPFTNGAVKLPEGYEGTSEWALKSASDEKVTEWFGAGANRKGYSYVWVYLELSRTPSSFMIFVFCTSVLFAAVSWAGLFINRAVAPARVTIAVIPVLIMLNLSNTVNSQLPPLAYLTWLTSFLAAMNWFTMLVVFEYGLVSCLMQMEVNRDRQFEAFKHIASRTKGPAAPVAPGPRAKAESFSDDRGWEDQAHQIVAAESPHQLSPEMLQVFHVFSKEVKPLDRRRVQLGFRQLGQYWSKDQIEELFILLDVEGPEMQPAHFEKMMSDIAKYLPGKAMRVAFWENPPSVQLDLAFRWFYICGILLTILAWLATLGA